MFIFVDARGTGKSTPVNCEHGNPPLFDPTNSTVLKIYSDCYDYMYSNFGKNLSYFSAESQALDLRDSMNLMNHTYNGMISLSYGTYMTNIFMQLLGIRVDVIILDGPWAPDRLWMGGWGPSNSDMVIDDLLSLCVANSSVCKDLLGYQGQLPTLVMNGELLLNPSLHI